MRNPRYGVVITCNTGASIRRLRVTHRQLIAAIATPIALVVLILALTGHGLWRRDLAREAGTIAEENARQQRILSELHARLDEAHAANRRVQVAFERVWNKSGLGPEPRLLGVGPIEKTDPPFGDLNAGASSVAGVEPELLPLELDRVIRESRDLQRELGTQVEYFYDAERLLSNTPSVRPAPSPWLTSGFGKRFHPVHKMWMMHKGLDLSGHVGMDIMAPADGVVIFAGYRGGYGKTIVIDHGYGLQTHFAHLSGFGVKNGDDVQRGQVIGQMGTSGTSTGPHLHYEVRRWGTPVDPRPYILDGPPDWSR